MMEFMRLNRTQRIVMIYRCMLTQMHGKMSELSIKQ